MVFSNHQNLQKWTCIGLGYAAHEIKVRSLLPEIGRVGNYYNFTALGALEVWAFSYCRNSSHFILLRSPSTVRRESISGPQADR